MATIKVLTEHGEREVVIFDSRDPHTWVQSYEQGAVYLIEEFADGSRLAFDRDYGLIGAVMMADAEFRSQILPLVFSTQPAGNRIVGPDDSAHGDTYWLEADDEAREAKRCSALGWAKEKREGRPTVQAFIIRSKERDT